MLWHSLFTDERSWERVEEDLSGERARAHHRSRTRSEWRSGPPLHDGVVRRRRGDGADVLGISEPVDWVGNASGGHVGVVFAAISPARGAESAQKGHHVQTLLGQSGDLVLARANRQWRSMSDSVRLSVLHGNTTFLQYLQLPDRPSVGHNR